MSDLHPNDRDHLETLLQRDLKGHQIEDSHVVADVLVRAGWRPPESEWCDHDPDHCYCVEEGHLP